MNAPLIIEFRDTWDHKVTITNAGKVPIDDLRASAIIHWLNEDDLKINKLAIANYSTVRTNRLISKRVNGNGKTSQLETENVLPLSRFPLEPSWSFTNYA